MIPVPVIPVPVISGLRLTQEHPYVTGVAIAVLLALAIHAASRSQQAAKPDAVETDAK